MANNAPLWQRKPGLEIGGVLSTYKNIISHYDSLPGYFGAVKSEIVTGKRMMQLLELLRAAVTQR
jgi:hypothetical protein